MKIFLDSADIKEIEKYRHLIDGVTTNPSLIAKSCNNQIYSEWLDTVVHLVKGPISVEVISLKCDEMISEARKIADVAENIVIKIPMTEEGLRATRALQDINIKTNVTLIFSPNQALLAAKAGATYASIFVGRLDDIGSAGMDVVRTVVSLYREYHYPTEVISASIRHPLHVIEAAKAGSHVATIPATVMSQLVRHPLTDIGLQQFLNDWDRFQCEKK